MYLVLNDILNKKCLMVPKTRTMYYQNIYLDKFHESCVNLNKYYWMPSFIDANDSSARTLDVYQVEHNKVINE